MAVCVLLNELQIEQRKLRFFEWDSTDQTNPNRPVTQNNIPLFLGADILSGCSIAVSNLPRMHAKYAKQGLAVKINFPSSVRLQGVRGSTRGVWFYSIQGLFKVCFEYYNRQEQLDCLTHLCPMWKLRFSDPLFEQEIDLSIEQTSRFTSSTKIATQDITDHDKLSSTESRSTQTIETCTVTCTGVTPLGKRCIEEISRLSKNEDQSEFDSLAVATMRILREFEAQRSQGCSGSSRMLAAISKCLGEDFHRFQLDINNRVTEFKMKHITSVHLPSSLHLRLPPSQELVQELFPDCMRLLLLNWIGNWDQPNIHSIIQVILELANSSLVSGVAHVLYSRLIRTDTV